MPELQGSVVAVRKLGARDRKAMFRLFRQYYDCVSQERFEADLVDKKDVIVLRDRSGAIQGFSTLKHIRVEVDGVRHRGIFSGDTVIARDYWGQRVLPRVFGRYLLQEKLRRPLEPLWWFLISKGYKTYLLMANNFDDHYPRHERPTPPRMQRLLDAFAAAYFPDAYDAASGLIRFPESLGQLKAHVAPIDPEHLDNPRIAFFHDSNPTWHQGTELACIARMGWSTLFRYSAKAAVKLSTGRLRAMGLLPATSGAQP